MSARFQDQEVPRLQEGDLESLTEEEAFEQIKGLMEEQNDRVEEADSALRYEKENSGEEILYTPDDEYGALAMEKVEDIDEAIMEVDSELDVGEEILYDHENRVMEIEMGWGEEREVYQVITEDVNCFEEPDSPIMFRNEKGSKTGIIEWYPAKDEIIMKDTKGERKWWKETDEYQEKRKLSVFRQLRSSMMAVQEAKEGKEWVRENPDSATRKYRRNLVEAIIPKLLDKGELRAPDDIKRFGEKGPRGRDLMLEFRTAVNRYKEKIEIEYGLDPDKIQVEHGNQKIIYEEEK